MIQGWGGLRGGVWHNELFAPLYLRSRIYTIPEFLERRFGWGLRAFLNPCNLSSVQP